MIDIAGELAARRGDRFEDYRDAIRSLAGDTHFPPELVSELEPLPGFRNVVVHQYVSLDLDRVVAAVRQLQPIERFIEIVSDLEAAS